MAECPDCGTGVAHPLKTWSMVGGPSKTGERFKLTLGLFECLACEKRFRIVLGKGRVTVESIVNEIKGVERGLMQILRSLREKIEKLENEKADLLKEIEGLREAGEEKAGALEEEVAALRKEVMSMKELFGNPE